MRSCECCGAFFLEEKRFCDLHCARSFSTKSRRKEISEKTRKTLSGRILIHREVRLCRFCGLGFEVLPNSTKVFCSVRCSGKSPEVRAKLSVKMVDAVIAGKIGGPSIRCMFPFRESEIRCDSKLEYACLDYVVKNLNPLEIERCGFSIPYLFLGEEKRFNPDFRVLTSDGTFIVECKGTCPNKQRNLKWANYSEKIPLKKEALEEYCSLNGFKTLWFEMKMHKKFYYSLTFDKLNL